MKVDMDELWNATISNCTQQHYGEEWFPLTTYVEVTYQSLFAFIGLPPNLLALVSIIRRIRHNSTASVGAKSWLDWVHLNLVIADLLILSLYCIGKTLWQLTFYWYGGSGLCRGFMAVSSLAFFLWSSVAVVSSLDICYCMYFPFYSHRKGPRRVKNWLACCWVVSTFLSAPQLVLWGVEEVPEWISCQKSKSQCVFLFDGYGSLPRYYQLFHILSLFYIPLTIIIVAYIGIGIMLLHYTIAWMPYQIVALMRILCGKGSGDPSYESCIEKLHTWEWLEGIMIFGACINPYIYQFRSKIGGFKAGELFMTIRKARKSRTHNLRPIKSPSPRSSSRLTPDRISLRSATNHSHSDFGADV